MASSFCFVKLSLCCDSRQALHQGLPVTQSEKWALNVWIHETPLDYFGRYLDDLGEFRSAIDRERATKGLPPTSASTGQAAVDHSGAQREKAEGKEEGGAKGGANTGGKKKKKK